MMSTETPADQVLHDFATLKRACDAVEGASGMRLWQLARQIARFAGVHKMKGSEIARGIGRSRGYVSRALSAARLPEPLTVEDGQRICDVFHGVQSAARRIKDSAAALKEAKTWARVAVKRGARPEAVELEIHEAIAGVVPEAQLGQVFRHVETSVSRPPSFQGVSTCRNTTSAALAMFLATALCAWTESAPAQCQYEATILPEIDCGLFGNLTPMAVNNLGHVVAYGTCDGEIAAVWIGGDTLTVLSIPPGYTGARPEDINDLGEVVGWVRTPSAQEQACLWRNGEAILLGIPTGANASFATGINNKSEVCGYSYNNVTGPLRAFIWRDGVMTDLNLPVGPNSVAEDINDHSQITGWMGEFSTTGCEAFVWSEGVTANLGVVPGGINGIGVSIGENSMVSGYGIVPTKDDPFRRESVQWRGTEAVNCGMLPLGERMIARGGNNFATVGYCDKPTSIGDRGFLYQGGVLSDLTDLVPHWVVHFAQDVNEHGQIIAEGRLNGGGPTEVILLTPVGEPMGDVSHDCRVNAEDLMAIITEWGVPDSYADTNNDRSVDVDDLIIVISNWTYVKRMEGRA